MRILLAFSLCAFAISAGAQMYRWTDAQGRVHVTDTPPPASAKSVKRGGTPGTPSYAPEAAAPQSESTAQEPYALRQARTKNPVTLYTVPSCEGCDAARNLLNARGVPFKEISLVDANSTNEFKKNVGASALPTMLVGSSQQAGFEESTYHQLLNDAGYPPTGALPPRKQAAPTASAAAAAPKPSAPQAKPAAATEPIGQASGPYAPGATAGPTEQPSGPYTPGAPPPPPPTKKK